MEEKRGIGIMIGSSMDGIDLADCSFSCNETSIVDWTMHKFVSTPLADGISRAVMEYKELNENEILALELDIAKNIVDSLRKHFSIDLDYIEFISLHGITVLHEPKNLKSIQLGDAKFISETLNIPVLSNFRMADILAGGEGTPMAPIVEQHLFSEYELFLNLGGIANISMKKDDKIIAFDVCPFNQVLNHYSRQLGFPFDNRGEIAKSGTINMELVNALEAIPYFKNSPPKSLDNNWIREEFIPFIDSYALSPQDALASMVYFSIKCIDRVIPKGINRKSLLITGGGAYNSFFIDQLKIILHNKDVVCDVPDGQLVEAKESVLMALSGFLRLLGIPNFIPSVTGAQEAVSGGDIYKP